jgi:integrase
MIEGRTLYSATHSIKIMTTIFRWGVENKAAPYNPFSGLKKPSFESRDRVWTDQELARFKAAVEALGRPSIALALMLSYDTARRPSDVLAIQRKHYLGDGRISFRQIKTKTKLTQPVSPVVAEAFEVLEDPEDYLIINEDTGSPWRPRTFRKWVQVAKKMAKLPKELQWRDLRRTVATQLANAGATEDEIMSVTGHRDRKVVGVYVREAEGRADNAWDKLQSYRGGKRGARA